MLEADLNLFVELGVAFAVGLVVGIERQRGNPTPFAGARTFPLIALAGAVGMLLGPVALAVIGGALAVLIGVAYFTQVGKGEADHGISTEVAAILTFGLGALCTAHDLPIAMPARLLAVAATGATVVLLLTYRRRVHGFVAALSDADVTSAVKLLALGAIVLPILPDETIDPWDTINPRALGLLVLLIAAISFAGYAAIRIFGRRRGTGLTAIFGGLASSTAVTLAFSGRVRDDPSRLKEARLAIVLASATMFPRVVVEVFAASPSLGPRIAWPLLAAAVVGFGAGAFYYFRLGKEARDSRPPEKERGAHESPPESDAPPPKKAADEKSEPRDGESESRDEIGLKNPFSIGSAIKFAAVFAAVAFASKLALELIGQRGAYLAALLSGIADVDAITLTLSRLHASGELDPTTAVAAICVAAATNSVVKIGIATVIGGAKLGRAVGIALGAALLTAVPFIFVPGLVGSE
jgi:uncharacterized membrane protein (DUF4010 family)